MRCPVNRPPRGRPPVRRGLILERKAGESVLLESPVGHRAHVTLRDADSDSVTLELNVPLVGAVTLHVDVVRRGRVKMQWDADPSVFILRAEKDADWRPRQGPSCRRPLNAAAQE